MLNEVLVATVKHGATFLVSSGVSTMVGYAAKSSVPKVAPHLIRHIPALANGWHMFQKVAIPAGAAALAGMASEHVVQYTEKKIDETVADINKLQSDMEAYVEKKKARKAESSESE